MRTIFKTILLSFVFCTSLLLANTQNYNTSLNPIVTSSTKIVVAPVITVTETLTNFTTCSGTASAPQTFTVSGAGSTGNITITAPAGYEINNGGGWSNTPLILTEAGGSVAASTISIRIAATTTTIATNLTITIASGSTNQNITGVNGTVNPLPIITGNSSVCVGLTISLTSSGTGTWTSSNATASVSNLGIVTGVSAGNPTITYTNSNIKNFSIWFKVSIY
jgi:hypothetical protein